jgi:hypothetical protein
MDWDSLRLIGYDCFRFSQTVLSPAIYQVLRNKDVFQPREPEIL